MDDPRPASIHFLARSAAGPAEPAKARPAHIHKAMSPEDVFRITLADCLAQMTANAATLRGQRSTEGLHQLRVGLRRLEVALGAFATEFGRSWLEELRGRAKILSSRLAPARDLDVFIGERLAKMADAEDRDLIAPLRARAGAARDVAWKQANDCIAGADFALFLDDVASLAQSRLPMARDGRLPRMGSRILARQDARARKRGRVARSKAESDLHRLRIALKKLRYTAEFFAPLYPVKKVSRYLKKVRKLQEQLGEINDIAHVRTTLASLLREDEAGKKAGAADFRFAAGLVSGWYRARRPRLAKKALQRWRRFSAVKPFWV